MAKQKVLNQVYESWEWLLRDKLEAANNIVRRIYMESTQSGVKPEVYEEFMRVKIAKLLKEVSDA